MREKVESLRSRAPAIARGFSLIEVLFVLGILAMLLAMLLPSLTAAREHSRRTICLSNLGTIGQGWRAYVEEKGGFPVELPPGLHLESLFGGRRETVSFPWNRRPHPKPINEYVGAVEEVEESTTMFRCPSDRGVSGQAAPISNGDSAYRFFGNSYWLNNQLLASRVEGSPDHRLRHPLRLSDIFAAGNVVLAGDFMIRERCSVRPLYRAEWHDREDQRLNVAFVEGNARSIQFDPREPENGQYRFHVRN